MLAGGVPCSASATATSRPWLLIDALVQGKIDPGGTDVGTVNRCAWLVCVGAVLQNAAHL